MIVENVSFKNNLDQKISGRIYRTESISAKGIVFCHGLFSTKDGIKITKLAPEFTNEGFTVLAFDFSFSGESDGCISDISVLQEVEDLRCAFNFFRSTGIREIHLVGSSMGGVVSLLFAASALEGVKSLTLIATPVMLIDLMYTITNVSDIESLPAGETTSIDGIPIKNGFFKEAYRIDTDSAVKKIASPTLIIHGGLDEVVPVSNAEHLKKIIACEKRTVIINDGDHNLTRERDLDLLKTEITGWIKVH